MFRRKTASSKWKMLLPARERRRVSDPLTELRRAVPPNFLGGHFRFAGGAVGFGISKPEHVSAVIDAGADAAIVGSTIVDLVGEAQTGVNQQLRRIEEYVRSVKETTRRAG